MRLTPSHEWPYGKPVPVSATLNVGTLAWSCTFDMGLQAGSLNELNWAFRKTGNYYHAVSATALGNVVSGLAVYVVPQAGADIAVYNPVASDVLSRRGEAADAFLDFPLT